MQRCDGLPGADDHLIALQKYASERGSQTLDLKRREFVEKPVAEIQAMPLSGQASFMFGVSYRIEHVDTVYPLWRPSSNLALSG